MAPHRHAFTFRDHGFAVLLIFIAATFSWRGTGEKAPTFDEPIHVTSGYAYWSLKDYRLQPENGNFTQRLSALPLFLLNEYPAIDVSTPAWENSAKWPLSDEGWFHSGHAPERIKWLSRAAMLLFNLGGLFLVYLLGAEFWGRGGAFVCLLMAAFSPNFLGHMPLATSDFAGAWTLALAVISFARLGARINLINVLLAGITIGLALLCKHSALIIGPVAFVLVVVRSLQQQPLEVNCLKWHYWAGSFWRKISSLLGAGLAAGGVVMLIVWSLHSWRLSAANPHAGEFQQFFINWDLLKAEGGLGSRLIEIANRWKLLPEAYLYGVDFIFGNVTRTNFLNGVFRNGEGFILYFPYCFLYKTPLPALILHIAGWICLAYLLIQKRLTLSLPLFGLLLTALLYGWMLLNSDMNIGYRHAFPFLLISCLFGGAVVAPNLSLNKGLRMLMLVLAASLIPLAWANRDRYISYMNMIGGGEKEGYRHLRESSIDWGQDLPEAIELVRKSLREFPRKPVYLSYFGSADPRAYNLPEVRYLPSFWSFDQRSFVPKLVPGLYVISSSSACTTVSEWNMDLEINYRKSLVKANLLYKRLDKGHAMNLEKARMVLDDYSFKFLQDFEFLRFVRLYFFLWDREPDEVLNGSILVYELNDSDFHNVHW